MKNLILFIISSMLYCQHTQCQSIKQIKGRIILPSYASSIGLTVYSISNKIIIDSCRISEGGFYTLKTNNNTSELSLRFKNNDSFIKIAELATNNYLNYFNINLSNLSIYKNFQTHKDLTEKSYKRLTIGAIDVTTSMPSSIEKEEVVSKSYGSISSEPYTESKFIAKKSELPNAGQITAGHWNDLENWDEWNNTLIKQNMLIHETFWGIKTENRTIAS